MEEIRCAGHLVEVQMAIDFSENNLKNNSFNKSLVNTLLGTWDISGNKRDEDLTELSFYWGN